MIFSDLGEQYYDWLHKIVCGEYKIEELTREVRKHNGFAEKIPVIQRDIQVLNHRMSDIEVHEYEHERSNV